MEREGARWGRIEVLEVLSDPEMLDGPEGPYHSGEYINERYRFRCDCGDVFELPAVKFPGRRQLKQCRKCDERVTAMRVMTHCPTAGSARQNYLTQIHVMVRVDLLEQVDAELAAHGDGLTRSDVVRLGMRMWLNNNQKDRKEI